MTLLITHTDQNQSPETLCYGSIFNVKQSRHTFLGAIAML